MAGAGPIGGGVFYDQPILLNARQAGAAIEGVIRQGSSEAVAQLAVDMHGLQISR
ncbi:hypothetical protein CS8_096570 [Cupriavidus sp. 8B]